MNNLSKILATIIISCLLTACAKKTQEAASYSPPTNSERESRPQDGQRQNRRGGPPEFSQLLAEMDSNQDGLLSATEVQGRLKKDFTKIDANQDGFITEEEMKNAPKPQRRGGGKKN